MKNKLALIYSWLVRTLLFFFPDIPFIMKFRGFLYSFAMKRCGKDFQVTHDAILRGLQNFSIGNNVFVGNHSVILGSGKITIEDQVLIAPNCIVICGVHTKMNKSFRYGPIKTGDVFIGKGSWIAANSTITMNSYLPPGSVLGANSYLNKKFDKMNSLYAGSPAKLIKDI